MTHFRIREAASLLGVSDDTVRRWAAEGLLESGVDDAGVRTVSGRSLAERVQRLAPDAGGDPSVVSSARNRFVGIVTRVEVEGLVAVVELQCGPNRVVSLMTAEAARELALEVGSRAAASVKATQVVVEAARRESRGS
ncbi:molybdopterin-binding protein [Leucobacter sp. wl10]|uniref:TOBE domain-containing protein n=1 Tax=Leucobacter sp. wl10 TaxID=2304677 RepID=UPI000E5A22D8|nr:TOBE domain-containing protein [Leucobacter sp. wl10]RGE21112.1 MerR family transcriptional regulator [Leucobacter sp. wl10]